MGCSFYTVYLSNRTGSAQVWEGDIKHIKQHTVSMCLVGILILSTLKQSQSYPLYL